MLACESSWLPPCSTSTISLRDDVITEHICLFTSIVLPISFKINKFDNPSSPCCESPKEFHSSNRMLDPFNIEATLAFTASLVAICTVADAADTFLAGDADVIAETRLAANASI